MNEEGISVGAYAMIFLLALIFGGMGGAGGYALGRSHGEVETLEIKKTLETYRVLHSDKERAAIANGRFQLAKFRRRVIMSQGYVDLLRALYGIQEKIKGIENGFNKKARK